jgi:ABC-2 type transport system ATP-binding protein
METASTRSPSADVAAGHARSAQAGTPVAVRTAALTKRYGGRAVVDGLDLALPAGVVSGFAGPNGAGKTTTLRMLLGLVRPTEGSGEVLGAPISRPAAYLPKVGAMIEGPAFYAALSARRNLAALARLSGQSKRRIDTVLERVGLSDRADDAVRSYSLGMKQRLGIAAALLGDPELLVLDEPTNGLDPAGIRATRALLRRLADEGTTVFVSSHLLDEIQHICDHIVLIKSGRLVFQGCVDELLGTQRHELVARPEDPRSTGALVALCEAAGLAAHVRDDTVHVIAPESCAGELNRRAMACGITLVALGTNQSRLEDAFFRVTERTPTEP